MFEDSLQDVRRNSQTRDAVPPRGSEQTSLCDLGGFGLLTHEAALANVQEAVSSIDGFSSIVVDRVGNVPKVVLCNFTSYSTMIAAVKTHKSIESVHGLRMAPDRSWEDRQKFKRIVKVKRGLIETCSEGSHLKMYLISAKRDVRKVTGIVFAAVKMKIKI